MALVATTLLTNPGKQDKRLEDFLIDEDAVGALYDAFAAFLVLTGMTAEKVPCVEPKSAAELTAKNIFIAGDSLGLGVLLLLLRDIACGRSGSPAVCAATGALTVLASTVVCREVGMLSAKVQSAASAGIDVMYCPVQANVPAVSHTGMLIKPLSVVTRDDISDFWIKVA